MSGTQRRQFLRVSLGLAGAAGWPGAAGARADALQWRERVLIGFGTRLWLRAGHADGPRLEAALDDSVRAIRHVEAQMSLFDPHSALVRLNRDGALARPDPHLLRVLALSRRVAQASGGAFDVTMQPLWSAWAAAQREHRLPSAPELRRARERVGWQGLQADAAQVRLARPGMAVSLNGIAQGYAADLARARLRSHGIAHALLDTGEWSPLGQGPGGADWTLALAAPRPAQGVAPGAAGPLALLAGDGRAVATSSDAHTAFSADRRHHHIIDPRSGYSPATWASVTVLARSGALADALTKVMFMAPADAALALARRWGVDVLLVAKSGRWRASGGVRWRDPVR